MALPLNSASVGLLGSTLRQTNGVRGRYIRGAHEVELVGVADRLRTSERGDEIERVSSLEQDWLFELDKLIIDGVKTLPERGDKWVTEDQTYEVHHRGEPETYRVLPAARLVRVYTVETEVDV